MSLEDNTVLIYNASYDTSIEKIIADIFDQFSFKWAGKNVLVKPNIMSNRAPEKAVTTHPLIVGSVAKLLLEKGAKVKVGDNPGVNVYGMSIKAARDSGILDVSQGCFIQLGQNPIKHTILSKFFNSVLISKEVLEADIIVNLPKLKTHSLTILSGAIKNTFGYVVGGDKMRVHSLAVNPIKFAEALVDIYQVRPPELNIMDAIDAMEGNGPSNGTVRRLNKILAAINAVSLDAVAINLIGQKINSVPHVEIAGKRGLGKVELDSIKIDGELSPVHDFKMPSTYHSGIYGFFLNRIFSNFINCVPSIINNKCKSCGVCVSHCPVHAMQMIDNFPKADKKQCISCYCCQELCPEGAIVLTGRLINTLRKTGLGG